MRSWQIQRWTPSSVALPEQSAMSHSAVASSTRQPPGSRRLPSGSAVDHAGAPSATDEPVRSMPAYALASSKENPRRAPHASNAAFELHKRTAYAGSSPDCPPHEVTGCRAAARPAHAASGVNALPVKSLAYIVSPTRGPWHVSGAAPAGHGPT